MLSRSRALLGVAGRASRVTGWVAPALRAAVRAALLLGPRLVADFATARSPLDAASAPATAPASADATEASVHVPVMLEPVVDLVASAPRREGAAVRLVVDGTVGSAAHTEAILRRLPDAIVLGIDRDPDMVRIANQRLERAGLAARARIAHGSFAHLEELLVQPDIASWLAAAGSSSPSRPDAVFLDLGINSFHVDEGSRGFSYRRDGPLDMRFDITDSSLPTASKLVSRLSCPDLERLFDEFGEEPLAGVVAKAIIKWRGKGSRRRAIKSTLELRHVIDQAIDDHEGELASTGRRRQDTAHKARAFRRDKTGQWLSKRAREKELRRLQQSKPRHPEVLQRCFQALRLAVNNERIHLWRGIASSLRILHPGGVFAVMSFQPDEDALVQNILADARNATSWTTLTPPSAVRATREEVRANARARSAHLRAFRKLQDHDLRVPDDRDDWPIRRLREALEAGRAGGDADDADERSGSGRAEGEDSDAEGGREDDREAPSQVRTKEDEVVVGVEEEAEEELGEIEGEGEGREKREKEEDGELFLIPASDLDDSELEREANEAFESEDGSEDGAEEEREGRKAQRGRGAKQSSDEKPRDAFEEEEQGEEEEEETREAEALLRTSARTLRRGGSSSER